MAAFNRDELGRFARAENGGSPSFAAPHEWPDTRSALLKHSPAPRPPRPPRTVGTAPAPANPMEGHEAAVAAVLPPGGDAGLDGTLRGASRDMLSGKSPLHAVARAMGIGGHEGANQAAPDLSSQLTPHLPGFGSTAPDSASSGDFGGGDFGDLGGGGHDASL